MGVQFWLSVSGKDERLRLPVNPSTVSVTSPFSYEDVAVAELGEVTILGERGGKSIAISSFFPKQYGSYCEYTDIPDPWASVQLIERWQDERIPLQLVITGTPITMPVTIRDFTYEAERSGSPGDIYYSMTLKEYKNVQLRTVTIGKDNAVTSPENTRPDNSAQARTHVVVAGESLWSISKKVYGSGNYHDLIYQANKSVIGANRNFIKPGMKLTIPAKK